MLITAIAQVRYAASLVLGRPFSLWALDRLIEAIAETQLEFGTLSGDAAEMIRGPVLDEDDRRELHVRRFRSQAIRAVRETAYYRDLFERLGLNPARLRYKDIGRLPTTSKEAVRDDPDAFVCATARPTFRTTTTGTTGKPTCICFSEHEMQTYVALNAIGLLLQQQLTSEDIVQMSSSSRATLGNTCFARACERIGALWYQTGLIEPTQALALLSEGHAIAGKKRRASFLNTYPSYLGQMVECGLAAGLGPADFGLERIGAGGEVVTAGLKARCQALFGPVHFVEGYAMTETWPFGGTMCNQGHLHFDVSQGMLEIVNPETSLPALPGEAGTIVATPLPPYRQTTIVLRYDTQDVVRRLADPLSCNLRHLPATTDVLGKLRLSVRHAGGWVYPRQVLEALEPVDAVPLPARFGFWPADQGVAVEVVVRETTPMVRRAITDALAMQDVPLVELSLISDPRHLRHPYPLRCDLRELMF